MTIIKKLLLLQGVIYMLLGIIHSVTKEYTRTAKAGAGFLLQYHHV